MNPEYGQTQFAKYDTDVAEPPMHDGVSDALRGARNSLDVMEEIVTGIENRIHGHRPAPLATSGANQAVTAPEPGVLRLASDNANRAQRLTDRLAKINATL